MKGVETWSTKLGKCKLRHGFKLVRKLLETKNDVRKWNKNVFGIVQERIKVLQASIAKI